MPVRVGVIGVGVMGAEHARLLHREVGGSEVSAVFDVDPARASAVAASSGAQVWDDPMVLVKDESVDAVVVASSDPTHEQFVLAAVAAGKPVLCEKPLAPDVAGCLRVIDAEVTVGHRLVSVGFMRRFDQGYLAIKEALVGGELGRALMLHCVHRNARNAPGLETSVLISGSAVHEIDIARWLLEEELVAVTVHTPHRGAGATGTQDPLFLVLESASGVLVDVEIFANAGYGYDVRCELVADRGTVSLDTPSAIAVRVAGQVSQGVPADWRPRFAEAYRRELQDWVGCVRSGKSPRSASAWDGYAATQVAQVTIEAQVSGRRHEVTLPDKPALYR